MIGAASQHIISAKRVWRTALKDHRAGVVAGTHINAMIAALQRTESGLYPLQKITTFVGTLEA